VGIIPDPRFLSTEAARSEERMVESPGGKSHDTCSS
jgi:hypothetical protein